ncbi:MAG: OmpH family outer membrane protein [Paracoccaceae bacterium]|nr:OmpH family outer membrane protein [Paracoccaceae bacterium]
MRGLRRPGQGGAQASYRLRSVVFLLGFALCGMPAMAQDSAAEAAAHSQILTLDWERLYEGSLWGQRVRTDIAAASQALTTENNRIADDLIAEERSLTERRAGMAAQAFRAEADAFDQRATGIRAAQKAKAQALTRRIDDERQAFIAQVVPLLDQILQQQHAAVVLDSRAIIRGLAQIDVTESLIALVDRELGAGGSVPDPSAPDATSPAPAAPPADTPATAPAGQ